MTEIRLSTCAAAAVLYGVFVGAGLLAACVIALVIIPDLRPYWINSFAISSGLGLGAASLKGIAYIHHLTPDSSALATYTLETEAARWSGPDAIRAAGYQILEARRRGSQATRADMERAGVDQRAWNAVNQILKALELKSDRGWSTGWDYRTAMMLWTDQVRLDGDHAFVALEPGAWKRVDY